MRSTRWVLVAGWFLSLAALGADGDHAKGASGGTGKTLRDCLSCTWYQPFKMFPQDQTAPPAGLDFTKLNGDAKTAAACGATDYSGYCAGRDESRARCEAINTCRWETDERKLDRCVPKAASLEAINSGSDKESNYALLRDAWELCRGRRDRERCETGDFCKWAPRPTRCLPAPLPFVCKDATGGANPKGCCKEVGCHWNAKETLCETWPGPVNDCRRHLGKKGVDVRLFPLPNIVGYKVDVSAPSFFSLPALKDYCKTVRHIYNGHGLGVEDIVEDTRLILRNQPQTTTVHVSHNSCCTFSDLEEARKQFLADIVPAWRAHPKRPEIRMAANQGSSWDHDEATERTNTGFVFAIVAKAGGGHMAVQYPARCHEGPVCDRNANGTSYLCRLPSTKDLDEFESPPDFTKLAAERIVRRTCVDGRWGERNVSDFRFILEETLR